MLKVVKIVSLWYGIKTRANSEDNTRNGPRQNYRIKPVAVGLDVSTKEVVSQTLAICVCLPSIRIIHGSSVMKVRDGNLTKLVTACTLISEMPQMCLVKKLPIWFCNRLDWMVLIPITTCSRGGWT